MKALHATSTHRFHAVRRAALRLAALVLLLTAAAAPLALHAQQNPSKRVLLISTGSRLAPGFMLLDQQITQALAQITELQIEIHAENLDTVRFPSERSQRIYAEYLAGKYTDYPPDLIVLIFVGNLSIPAGVLSELFPDVPVVVAGQTEETLQPDGFGARVSGFAQRTDPAATLSLMLRLQPDLRRIVVIGGTAEIDRQLLERVEKAAATLKDQVETEFWTDVGYAELRQRVSAMPPHSAILFTRFFRDSAGQAYASSQVGQMIGRTANAPVYVLSDASFGTGAVGGALASLEELGNRTGVFARSILTGTPPESFPFEIRSETVPMFDWRALKRWEINERLLPPQSVVRFRPQSMWQQYGSYIAAALIVMMLQSVLIVALVLQRSRLRRVQTVLSQNRQLMELATSAGGLGLWSRDTQTGELWANGVLRSLLGVGDEPLKFEDVMARVHPDDRERAGREIERAQQAGLPFEAEYRVVLSDGRERWLLGMGRMDESGGRNSRRVGVILDITERKRAEERLRESEDNFRRLVESTAAVIWQADPQTWLFTYVGPQAVKLLGYPLAQWYEKDFWASHIHPEDRDHALSTCVALCRELQDFQFDYRMIRADGEIVWIHDIVNCQLANGSPAQLRGLMFDVTERKLAEQALRESEDRFRTVANAAPVMVWMADTDKLCIFLNSGWLRFTGRTFEQELGYGWWENIHPDDLARAVDTYSRAFDLRHEFRMEYRMRRHDGEYCFILDNGVPRYSSDGTFLGYIGTCIDVTDLKHAEESLDREHKFLLQVIDINPNLIFAKDRDGRFTLANQAVAAAYGVTVDDVIGRTDADFNPRGDEVAYFRKMDLEVMDTLRERFIPEERMTDAQGNVHWLQTVKRPIVGIDGGAHQVLGTSTDITQRRHTELQLQEQRAQMTHFARVSVMGELAASLAHELNQPLAAILSNAQAALRFMDNQAADPYEIREILQDIVAANRRAGEVIRHVRALVKKREAEAEFVSVDVPELIRDTLALLHSDMVAQNVLVSLEVPDDLPAVWGDRVQLQQVVLNILLNAFDAMSDIPLHERSVTIRLTRTDGKVRVSISDRGHGLSEGARDKIFLAFYTTKAEGLGMGLAICGSIMESHGGTLSAENNPGGGATFFFTVPVHTTSPVPDG